MIFQMFGIVKKGQVNLFFQTKKCVCLHDDLGLVEPESPDCVSSCM